MQDDTPWELVTLEVGESGLLHIIVYVGFIVINIELLEIVLDGFLGTHRVLSPYLGTTYDVLIATFEIFAFLVIIAVTVFWLRRNAMRIRRFWKPEIKGWPKKMQIIFSTSNLF